MTNEKLAEKTMIKIARGTRMELKIQAALKGKTMEEYLEEIINHKKNERLLKK